VTVRRFGWLRASTSASSGAPPVKMKAPKGAMVFGDPSGTVDLARAARDLAIEDQNSP
jgi:hypothetical protein